MPCICLKRPQRRGKHSRERGAIYIESLLVLVVLVILFASSLFFAGAYRAKLETFAQASAIAFQSAEKGCGPLLGGAGSVPDVLGQAPSDPSDSSHGSLGGAVQAPAARSDFSIENSDVLFPRRSWNFTSESQVMCNERPVSKDEALSSLRVLSWAISEVLRAAGF